MDSRQPQPPPPPYFHLKKYSIMGFTIVQIILLVIFIVIAGIALGATSAGAAASKTNNNANVDKAVIIYVMVSCVIAILIQMLGLFGAWKEHFCMSCTYAILSALSFLFGIYGAIRSPSHWLSEVISLLVTIVAILFTIDLRRMRRTAQTAVY